jgi:hypothetical protein
VGGQRHWPHAHYPLKRLHRSSSNSSNGNGNGNETQQWTQQQ